MLILMRSLDSRHTISLSLSLKDMLAGLNPPNPVVQIGVSQLICDDVENGRGAQFLFLHLQGIKQLNQNDRGTSQRFRAQLSDGNWQQPCKCHHRCSILRTMEYPWCHAAGSVDFKMVVQSANGVTRWQIA